MKTGREDAGARYATDGGPIGYRRRRAITMPASPANNASPAPCESPAPRDPGTRQLHTPPPVTERGTVPVSGPVDPSPTLDQVINGGYPWLEIRCSRCRTPRSVDLVGLRHVETTCIHDLAGRLRCAKCREAGKRPAAELLQLGKGARNYAGFEA